MNDVNALHERMLAVRRLLQQSARQFAAATADADASPRQALLQLQKHMDHLRQAIWDARKLCDPNLVPFPCNPEPEVTQTLAERVVLVIDARKKTA